MSESSTNGTYPYVIPPNPSKQTTQRQPPQRHAHARAVDMYSCNLELVLCLEGGGLCEGPVEG
jgi:hypothetical protein